MSTAGEIWNMVLSQLSAKVTPTAVSTWLADCEPVDMDEYRLVLRTGSELKKKVITDRFSQMIVDALCDLFSCGDYELILLDRDEEFARAQERKSSVLPPKSGFTFDDFVVGDSNRFAYAAAAAVAGNPGKKYNPLFIYGNTGLGKTHLLLAVGHAVQERNPQTNIAFARGERFTDELIRAIKEGTTEEFRGRYRNVDLLLMDDIQFIAGKEATQNEFFHTFNDLYEADRQIVICSDRPPAEMSLLDDRLRTRFEGGLMAEIQPPDLETRTAILRRKAEAAGLSLPDETIAHVAGKVRSNVRRLEGVVQKMAAYVELMGGELTGEAVDAIMEEVCREEETVPTPDLILRETARYFLLDPEDLKRSVQTKNISLARQIAMYQMRRLTPMVLTEIGRVFRKDHSTVLSSVRKIEELRKKDPKTANILRDIESNILNTGRG